MDQSASFSASGSDTYGNPVDVSATTWSLSSGTLGSLDKTTGASVVFTASSTGSGTLTASLGGFTPSATITVTQASLLPAPSGFSVVAHGKHINIAWQPVNGAASYNLYRGTSSGGEQLYQNVTSTSVNDMNVNSGTTYWYYVAAVAPDGTEGDRTTEASATPK